MSTVRQCYGSKVSNPKFAFSSYRLEFYNINVCDIPISTLRMTDIPVLTNIFNVCFIH